MSLVSLEVVAKLREELGSVMSRTLAYASSAKFCRRLDRGNRLVATLDPSPQLAAKAVAIHERFRRWHGITKSLLRRYALTPPIDLDQKVRTAAVYVLLQRATPPDIPEGRWRDAFDLELTRMRLELEQVLDLCQRSIPPSTLPAVYVPVDVRIDMSDGGNAHVTADDVNGVIEACARGKTNVAMLERLGAKLFPLFGDDLRGSPRWIRLHLDNADFLAHAPWESLHDGAGFLALQPSTVISRSFAPRTTVAPSEREAPLRLLVTISSPSDLDALRGDHEAELLRDALGGLELIGRAHVDIVTDGSLDTMRRMLRAAEEAGRPYNAWHFIGHGRFNDGSGRSELALTGINGKAQYVGEAQLRTLFDGHALRLAMLNACESGMFAPMDCGAAAVVAMQFRISDDAAIVVADEVYGALAAGASILGAMTDVRRALFCRPPGVEWITPVLFLEEQFP